MSSAPAGAARNPVGWKTTPDGALAVHPVAGWETTTLHGGMTGGLRIDFATDKRFETKSYVQLQLSRAQAKSLIMGLMDLVESMDRAGTAEATGRENRF